MNAHFETEGIGTHWWFELLDTMTFPPSLIRQITATIEEFNADYTRFRDDSYVGRLNVDKKLSNPPAELIDMMDFAKKMYAVSGGAFNISIGGALHAVGYGSRERAGTIHEKFWDETKYNRDEIIIPGDATIDLGGLGKGWLIDKLAEVFRAAGFEQFIINGGGDIYVSSDEPIELGLEHPHGHTKMIGMTRMTRGALGVSSNVKRIWEYEGKTHHHIIDPVTGTSASSDVVSTYVRADTALIADTMATILLLRPQLDGSLSKKFDLKTILFR